MSAEMLAYPFLFIAIFFESFVLVTFLSAPARFARRRAPAHETFPSVAIIVPCFNEERTIAATVRSLLALDYPKEKISVILVDNASTDGTASVMAHFSAEPQVSLIREEARGKHNAMNAGLRATNAELVGCLDADSFVEPDSLRHLIPCFTKENVAAATAAMSVHEPKSVLQHMQYAEYFFGIAWRHTLSSVNGLYVTPGPFSLYRREVVARLGGFRYGHQVEDMELALRLQRHGYEIENAPRARVYTKAPLTLFRLLAQRTRWTSGFLRNIFFDYRDFVLSPSRGALGMLVLPLALTSIASGILLFSVVLLSAGANAARAFSVRGDIPLTYAYLPSLPTFDWFYIPATFFTLLAATTIAISISLIVIGKRISQTPGRLLPGLLSYLLLYGLVAPLWLIRATADVALGKRRAWR